MFNKILIANRGEIAVRIIHACKELGIKTVAVFSDVERDSMHVKLADEAVCIGPAPISKSYLYIPNIISAALIYEVDAIHPGYGFLAENARFAEICEHHSLKFIGPSIEAMRKMGDKAQARLIAQEAGVPVIPGSFVIESDKDALKVAEEIGFPLVIKAVAGGGGKGMRVVESMEDLLKAIPMARMEAEAAFADSRIYIEKYLENPRHIEIQMLADSYGNCFHLGERECSIQRRNQKLIEESPSVIVTERDREELGELARRLMDYCGYHGAGTVEFLREKQGNFYFLEMNTRIQVEHPVTEMVTGIDIIKEQIRIAGGEKLNLTQKDIFFRGHSIECRINAEDPDTFIPATGSIEQLYIPGGPGVRIDTHLTSGYKVLPFYDSLLAKAVVWGNNRDEAIERMSRVLEEFIIEGVKTNIPFQQRVISSVEFITGDIHVNFVEGFLYKDATTV